jgi:hypothetical protein
VFGTDGVFDVFGTREKSVTAGGGRRARLVRGVATGGARAARLPQARARGVPETPRVTRSVASSLLCVFRRVDYRVVYLIGYRYHGELCGWRAPRSRRPSTRTDRCCAAARAGRASRWCAR